MHLHLPLALEQQLWQCARQQAPHEAVGVLGGHWPGPAEAFATRFYPLDNVAPRPQAEYLAHPGQLLRVFKALERDGLALVALFHSHPAGPDCPSPSDIQQAAYAAPYLIADLKTRRLRGFLLPERGEIELMVDGEGLISIVKN